MIAEVQTEIQILIYGLHFKFLATTSTAKKALKILISSLHFKFGSATSALLTVCTQRKTLYTAISKCEYRSCKFHCLAILSVKNPNVNPARILYHGFFVMNNL